MSGRRACAQVSAGPGGIVAQDRMEGAAGSGLEAALGSHRDGWLQGVALGRDSDLACVWEAMARGSESPSTCGALGYRPSS